MYGSVPVCYSCGQWGQFYSTIFKCLLCMECFEKAYNAFKREGKLP